jgi:fibronectin type 3 domain-containing protein
MKKLLLLIFVILTGIVSASFGAGHYVTLTWNPSSDGAANPTLSYNVFRGATAGNESTTPIATGVAAGCTNTTTCTYSDPNVSAGQTYFYTVTAVLGGQQSAQSNECSTVIPLGAPSGLSCKGN